MAAFATPRGAEIDVPYLAALGEEGATLVVGVRDDGRDFNLLRAGGPGDDLHFDPTGLPSVADVRLGGDRLSWRVDGDLADADLTGVFMGNWQVLLPPGRRSLRRPELPPDLADLWPAEIEGAGVVLIGKASVLGWDDARQRDSDDVIDAFDSLEPDTWASRASTSLPSELRR